MAVITRSLFCCILLGKKAVSGVLLFPDRSVLGFEPVHYNRTCGSLESLPPPNVYVLFKQVYQHVPRLWKPAESCPECHYVNDVGFQYCHRCGFHKEMSPSLLRNRVPLDLPNINARFHSL